MSVDVIMIRLPTVTTEFKQRLTLNDIIITLIIKAKMDIDSLNQQLKAAQAQF